MLASLRVPDQVLAIRLLFQPPVNTPEREAEEVKVLDTHVGDEGGVPGFSVAHPLPLQPCED